MTGIARPLRIEPAFDDRDAVLRLFETHGPFAAAAKYLPDGSDESGEPPPPDAVLPWFRANWALGGQERHAGAKIVLQNPRYLAAARTMYPRAEIVPKTVVVNVNPPMPAGFPHVDVPSFHGATRESVALRLLIAMGASGLFEPWRVVEAGAIAWFYDGAGGAFDYWPDGPHGPMRTEQPPFGNVAILADNDRMYHRIGRVGEATASLPRMTAGAEIRLGDDGVWTILDGGVTRARYPREQVRLSVLWKAEVVAERSSGEGREPLSPPLIVERIAADLARRGSRIETPPDAHRDEAWIESVYRLYSREAAASAPPRR